jgi:hypothetical protein
MTRPKGTGAAAAIPRTWRHPRCDMDAPMVHTVRDRMTLLSLARSRR